MKKTYIAPEMDIIEVRVANMVATSIAISGKFVDDDEMLGRENNSVSNSNVWDLGW